MENMASKRHVFDGARLGPRINLRRDVPQPRQTLGFLSSLMRRSSDDDCSTSATSNTCEKPVTFSSTTLPIVLGTVIPACLVALLLVYLWRRNVKKQRVEDAKDLNLDLDFGVADGGIVPTKKGRGFKGQRKSLIFPTEKSGHKVNQLSMDMNLSSPYLLPPGAQQSHESLHSLARTFPAEQDPYHLVPQYVNSETGSIRSATPNGGSVRGSVANAQSPGSKRPPPGINSFPRPPLDGSSPSIDEKSDPFATPTAPAPAYQLHELSVQDDGRDSAHPAHGVVPEIGSVAYPEEKRASEGFNMPELPDVPQPPAVLPKSPESRIASPPAGQYAELPAAHDDQARGMAHASSGSFHLPPLQSHEAAGLGLDLDLPKPMSPETGHHDYQGPHAVGHSDNVPMEHSQPQIQTSEYFGDFDQYAQGNHDAAHDSMNPQAAPGGLGVPQQDGKRLSVGFRPLPPDDVTESDDPEYRANRIRSFYKEYFDDSKEVAEPVPPVPTQYYGDQYYEDYDENYLGDAAYYDADTNAFVMPYAQPVTRRAMTPPPMGRQRDPPGPRGPPRGGPRPPHGPHGSLGGMSLPGGPGRPRAGSAWGRGPSSLGPRPGSSASAASRGRPKKKLPPPSALNTLPAPSKLRDDSFAILNAADFAPPDSFKDHQAGRSQSPLGERRPYSPQVPVASPLVTAFDELSSLPSPHLLRKSSTFTGLDFAPPKKFQDSDTMSDAGSIRSNRSGISAVQLSAIRSGAGRVSRLPGDEVFTKASLADQLKPQWGVRQ